MSHFRRVLCLLMLLSFAAFTHAASKPNILFIFADDMAFDTINALGWDEIQTPNLDRLVKSGMTFPRAYNQGGYHGAVCVASRTMLNTGRFLWNAQRAERVLKSDYQAKGRMWSQLLAKAGYETFFTGKWHVRADTGVIFSTARNVRGGMPNQTPAGYNRPIDGQKDPWSPYDPKFGGFWKGGKHWSEVVGDDGVDYINSAAKNDKPFFMYLAFNAPHDPRQAPKKFVDMYPLDKIALPEPFYADYPYQIGSNRIRDEKLAPFPRTEYSVKVNRQEYYAIITHMDEQIGRILDALEKSGQKDNTYIFFTADHGLAVGHHGLMGKQNMFDHSIRVPFMVSGPKIPAGSQNDARIYLQDVMPTSLELAGTDVPEDVQFKSILPLVQGKAKQSYDSIYTAYTATQRALTQGDMKLIAYPSIGKTLLFNVASDPWETKDLAGDPKYAATVAKLRAELKSWQPVTGDSLNLDAPVNESKKSKKSKSKK